MAGWSAMAGTHEFVVPDETYAQELAKALAAYGFPEVKARPSDGDDWRVTALDEGPYPVDALGHRQIEAVARAAAAIARQHSGYARGGTRCDVSQLRLLRGPDAPYVSTNPGARPPIPTITVVAPPPPAPLPLTPDEAQPRPVELPGLDDVPWAELEHAHGSADDVPELLWTLATSPADDWDETLDELFGDDLLHQGSCYSATAPALPFLTHMIVSGTLPARQRLDLCVWLLLASGQWAGSLLAHADAALVQNRPPEPAGWTEEVHRTVGEQLPALLTRWAAEPPAVRFVLACLAGLHPHHGRRIGAEVDAMAREFHGTRPGAYLLLADALVDGRDDQALALATDIVAWEDGLDPGWLDATNVTATVRACHVLADGALRALNVE